MTRFKQFSWFFLLAILLESCSSYGVQLKNGDFLFISANTEELSTAIDAVTQTDKSTHYSHVAFVEKENNNYWVLHAGTKNGSERISLASFIEEEQEKGNFIDVYRLKKVYKESIPAAISTAKTWLGKPYNYSYIRSDEKLYCSDYIQRSFEKDTIFDLNPMTFINPTTGEVDSTWVAFYKKQNIEVPEGQLGCNPNGMAASTKIDFIGQLTNTEKK